MTTKHHCKTTPDVNWLYQSLWSFSIPALADEVANTPFSYSSKNFLRYSWFLVLSILLSYLFFLIDFLMCFFLWCLKSFTPTWDQTFLLCNLLILKHHPKLDYESSTAEKTAPPLPISLLNSNLYNTPFFFKDLVFLILEMLSSTKLFLICSVCFKTTTQTPLLPFPF